MSMKIYLYKNYKLHDTARHMGVWVWVWVLLGHGHYKAMGTITLWGHRDVF